MLAEDSKYLYQVCIKGLKGSEFNKVREWYDTQNVDMVTDALNSAVAIAIGKVSHEKNKLAMIVGAGSSRLSNEDCNLNTIHYAYDTYALGNISGNAVVKAGGKSWYFLTADYAFGAALQADTSAVVKAAGGKVEKVDVTLGLRDARTERVEVTAGLSEGDVVLRGAAQGITPGTPVQYEAPR